MTAETNAERLQNIKNWHQQGCISHQEIDWLIQQAERAQELDDRIQNKILPEIEAGYKQNIEFREENARLREALEQIQEKLAPLRGVNSQHDNEITDICIEIYKALKGESE